MVECPVCLRDFEVGPDAKDGDVVQCPHCKIWIRLVREGNEWVGERV